MKSKCMFFILLIVSFIFAESYYSEESQRTENEKLYKYKSIIQDMNRLKDFNFDHEIDAVQFIHNHSFRTNFYFKDDSILVIKLRSRYLQRYKYDSNEDKDEENKIEREINLRSTKLKFKEIENINGYYKVGLIDGRSGITLYSSKKEGLVHFKNTINAINILYLFSIPNVEEGLFE